MTYSFYLTTVPYIYSNNTLFESHKEKHLMKNKMNSSANIEVYNTTGVYDITNWVSFLKFSKS